MTNPPGRQAWSPAILRILIGSVVGRAPIVTSFKALRSALHVLDIELQNLLAFEWNLCFNSLKPLWCPRDSHMLVCHSPRDHYWSEDTTIWINKKGRKSLWRLIAVTCQNKATRHSAAWKSCIDKRNTDGHWSRPRDLTEALEENIIRADV